MTGAVLSVSVIEADDELLVVSPLFSFAAEAVAVLLTTPQFAVVVGLVTWTFFVARFATLPKLQLSTLPGPTEQVGSEFSGSTVQVMPGLEGSESDSVTLFARPGPIFLTWIVKPI